jgi:hypothetical protein
MTALILAMMLALAPLRTDLSPLAETIARVVEAERPLFAADDDRRKTAALVVAVAFRESSFRMDAVSKTDDHCALQVHGRPDLAKLPDECIRTGVAMMRESMRVCAAYPLAHYAEGPRGCASARAQRISKDRMTLAAWVARKVAL